MARRKAISKRVRFEIFKRDSFKCQYCGQSAPDVKLEIEHVLPVSKGGGNDPLNLLTACSACNSGKSDVKLDDASMLNKQKRQAEELNERRLQLKMMMDWKNELLNIDTTSLTELERYWTRLTNHVFSDSGREAMRKNLKNFGLSEVLQCMDISTSQYSDIEKAFQKVGAIAQVRRKSKDDPHYEALCMVRGILRRNLNYVNYKDLEGSVRTALGLGIPTEWIIKTARDAGSWTKFHNSLLDEIEGV